MKRKYRNMSSEEQDNVSRLLERARVAGLTPEYIYFKGLVTCRRELMQKGLLLHET